MKITVKQLKSIIAEAVQLSEVATKVPTNFSEFRKLLGTALRASGAPEDLVEEVEDVGYEGGGVAAAIADGWNNIEYEFDMIRRDRDGNAEEQQHEVIANYVHDIVIDVVDAYKNSMNYEPGRKSGKLDAKTLAQRVQSAFDLKKF